MVHFSKELRSFEVFMPHSHRMLNLIVKNSKIRQFLKGGARSTARATHQTTCHSLAWIWPKSEEKHGFGSLLGWWGKTSCPSPQTDHLDPPVQSGESWVPWYWPSQRPFRSYNEGEEVKQIWTLSKRRSTVQTKSYDDAQPLLILIVRWHNLVRAWSKFAHWFKA